MGSTAAIEAGVLRAALSIALVSLIALNPPLAFAGRADARSQANEVDWTSANRQRKQPAPKPAGHDARLRWKRTQAAPQRLPADEQAAPLSGPELASPDVRRASPEVAGTDAADKVRLMTFNEPANAPALDPFQDEVYEEDDGAATGEEPEPSHELLDENAEPIAENGAFDPDEVAQRSGDRDNRDLPNELQFEQRDDDRPSPSLGTEYAQTGPGEPERCPSPRDLKPINQISHRIAAEPGLFPQECALSDYEFQPRNFKPVTYTWKASALCHKPLYFQQPKLERYGHTFGILTPIISAGHFFVMVPCLPYNMGLEAPWECVYPLGWYRPGDCAPYTLGPLPLSLRGAINQGVITTGLWFLFQ